MSDLEDFLSFLLILGALTVASSVFLLTVTAPIGNFLPRYLELGTDTPYHETESLDEIHFEWFEKIKHQRSFTAAMTQFPILITLNYFIFEPFKMDFV